MIVSHEHPLYQGKNNPAMRQNGAYYYSCEIVKNIIPNVKTDRNWVTIYVPSVAANHSVYFIHNNKNPAMYEYLSWYKDKILVCGIPETCEKVSRYGRAIYLPLSVDVEYVKQFRTDEKKINVAFVGRRAKREGIIFPKGTVFIEGENRPDLLRMMAKCKKVFAVGRTAIEARILGCEVLPYDPRFPDPSIWQVLDNRDAAKILQAKIDEIDGGQDAGN